LLRQLNDERRIRRLGVTRRALFEELDRPNLNSLSSQPYCFAEWRVRRVGVDYHVELELVMGDRLRRARIGSRGSGSSSDSPLEGDGFEPSVPQQIRSPFDKAVPFPMTVYRVSRPGTES
jgi:hypothetical protein